MNDDDDIDENVSKPKRILRPSSHTYVLTIVGDLPGLVPKLRRSHLAMSEMVLHLYSEITDISCGNDWICILTSHGQCYTFGHNNYGQLGLGHTTVQWLPRPVTFTPMRQVKRVSSGSQHGGFVLENGELFMFGRGSYGRLGTGNEKCQFQPIPVVMHWGDFSALEVNPIDSQRHHSRLPTSSLEDYTSKERQSTSVATLHDGEKEVDDTVFFLDISCGDRHTLTIVSQPNAGGRSGRNRVVAFGDNMNGRLGVGNECDKFTGALLTEFQTVYAAATIPHILYIHAGRSHSAAVASTGELFLWGDGRDGQLGHGSNQSELKPRRVEFFNEQNPVATVQCGSRHTIAFGRNGSVYAWGRGMEGQLGLASTTNTSEPQEVHLENDSNAPSHANTESCESIGESNTSATDMLFLLQHHFRVTAIHSAGDSCIALADDRTMYVWGQNESHKLDGGTSGSLTPILKPATSTIYSLRWPKSTQKVKAYDVEHQSTIEVTTPTRESLVHIAMSDNFSVLVYAAKSIELDHHASSLHLFDETLSHQDGDTEGNQQSTHDNQMDTSRNEINVNDLPSKEAKYLSFMRSYKIKIPREELFRRNLLSQTKNANRKHRTPHNNAQACLLQSKKQANSVANSDGRSESMCPSRPNVHGYDAWVAKRSAPVSNQSASYKFGMAARFPLKKESESRCPSTIVQVRSQSCAPIPPITAPPRRKTVASAFGRTLAIAKPRPVLDVNVPAPRPATTPHHHEAGAIQPVEFPENVAFGSSVADRLPPAKVSEAQSPIYPEKCTLTFPKPPRAHMGDHFEFSKLVSWRLLQAKGPTPGPGTYDRVGD